MWLVKNYNKIKIYKNGLFSAISGSSKHWVLELFNIGSGTGTITTVLVGLFLGSKLYNYLL